VGGEWPNNRFFNKGPWLFSMRQVMNFNNVEKIQFAMPPNNCISRIGNYFIRKIIIWSEVGGTIVWPCLLFTF